jgi:hypothetical protein
MAAIFADASEGLKRTTNIVAASSDFTMCGWFYVEGVPLNDFGVHFYRGNDPVLLYSQYVWIGREPDNTFSVYLNGTNVQGPVLSDGWHFFAYVKEGTAHRFYIGDTLLTTITADVSGHTYTHEYLGADEYADEWAESKATRFMSWNVDLSAAQIRAQRLTSTPVTSTGLWMNTPLLTDNQDDSGNGYHWSDVDGTVTYEADPTLPTNVVKLFALDEGGATDDDPVEGVDEDGTAFAASLVTKPFAPAHVINQFGVTAGKLIAKAAEGVEVEVSLLRNYEATEKVATVDLSPEASEEDVIKTIDPLSMAELRIVQYKFADTETPAGRWDLSHFAVRQTASEKGT